MREDPEPSIPHDGTTPRMLRRVAEVHGQKIAIWTEERQVGYAELLQLVRRAAAGFIDRGVERGDRVAIWAPNGADWIVAALALQWAGAALIPINTRFKGAEVRYLLERSRAKVLVVAQGFLDLDYLAMLEKAAGPLEHGTLKGLPDLTHLLVMGGGGPEGTEAFEDLFSDDTASLTIADSRADEVTPDDLSDILFTSGTTGLPKGAMTTHHTTIGAFRELLGLAGLMPDDRMLIVNPFFHAFGYRAGWLACLMYGATAYPLTTLDADTVADLVAKEQITVLPGTPTLFIALMDAPNFDQRKFESLRFTMTGGTTLPPILIRRLRSELGFEHVMTAYGTTESAAVGTACRQGDDDETVALTSGRAMPGMEVRVVGDEGIDLPAGEKGEILLRGWQMQGYLDDPEATAETIDAEGWVHSGDVGSFRPDGNIMIHDRIKDMIIVGGFNVYPAEVENFLLQHEAVGQAAVVARPDTRMGQVAIAFVVPKPGYKPDPADLHEWAREQMANFKVPREFR
ncbi:MAG TPA: AMP-binding protein, partial [Acidimicrobiales bacterium]